MLVILNNIYNAIKSILDYAIKVISTIMVFFGAYIPFFYLIYGFILKLIFHFQLFDSSSSLSQLFILGFSISILASVIITLRKLVFYPIATIRNKFKYKKSKRKRIERKHEEQYNPNDAIEQPVVYRSSKFPDIIVYEYNDFFDLYKERNGHLVRIKTEYKNDYEYQ